MNISSLFCCYIICIIINSNRPFHPWVQIAPSDSNMLLFGGEADTSGTGLACRQALAGWEEGEGELPRRYFRNIKMIKAAFILLWCSTKRLGRIMSVSNAKVRNAIRSAVNVEEPVNPFTLNRPGRINHL